MRSPVVFSVIAILSPLARTALAQDGASAAAAELRQGYALKTSGNCRDAIGHFDRSLKLDAKPKAALNLADCEARTGDLVAARAHATQGARLAREQNDGPLVDVAAEQLADVEKRLPELTILLAPAAPPGSVVTLDGVALDAEAVAQARAANPGAHVVSVSAAGHMPREFRVALAEGARQSVEVAPGGQAADIAEASHDRDEAPSRGPFARVNARTAGALGLATVSATGVVVGSIFGIAALTDKSRLDAHDCPTATTCRPGADLGTLHDHETVANVGFGVGVGGAVAAALWWLAVPHAQANRAGRSGGWVEPWAGASSMGLRGGF